MKWFKFFIGSMLLSLLVVTALHAQTSTASQMGQYIKAQNYTAAQAIMAQQLTVNFNAREQKVGKASAISQLKTFLSKNQPVAYSAKHNGKSENDSKFYTGTLKTETGNFDVYFIVKDEKVIELCIEE